MQDKGKRKRKKGLAVLLIVVGILLIAGAVLLVAYNKRESYEAGEESASILEEMEQAMPEERKEPAMITEDTDLTMPVVMIDGYAYIGRIAIPSINIDLPVMAEWDEERLWVSPCLYTGNYKTDDMVICAHNFDTHFGQLLGIGIGEQVIFTAVDGTVYRYIISNRETVQPTAIEVMIENQNNAVKEGILADWDLTLFTCHIGGQTRCAVRCMRVEE